ncbi:MAG: hypothetical protein Q9187_006028, partial [Circinaria calcarea]
PEVQHPPPRLAAQLWKPGEQVIDGRAEGDVDGGGVVLVLRGNEDDMVGDEEDTEAGTDEVDEGPGAVVVCRDALVDVEATTVGWTTTTAVEARIPE